MHFLFDPLDDYEDDEYDGRQPKTCQFCGKHGLYWEQAGGKWKLAEPDGEFHECKKVLPPSIDGFEDLTT